MANWTQLEDELIIKDYFLMLNAELKGLSYNKSEHRKHLLTLLKNRNGSAIEFKHRNISAVLIKYGMPYIKGYKPLSGYQQLLEEEVLRTLEGQKGIEKGFEVFASKDLSEKPAKIDFTNWKKKAPAPLKEAKFKTKTFNPVKRNYLEIEQNNHSIGHLGEQLVFDYEVWRLHKAELPKLAKQVKWVSKDLGDGAGFDILSKATNGDDMYIEVKTTKLGKESPIFFSITEYEFAKFRAESFFLYRVFNVRENPKIFIKNGPFDNICSFLQATNFKGYF